MFKNIKENILSTLTARPKLVTLAIGLAITVGIGTVIGLIDSQQALAFQPNFNRCGNNECF
jgi:hypothetical protein